MSAPALVQAYDRVLERQILGRGSCLACRDESLRLEVEELLKESDARETHRLGLDPLRVMEESLMVGGARRGLRDLAKAFEVLEQAALNLYLGPWRAEYRLIQTYSGTFTHYISPVLSTAQTERLFGLLGYRPGPRQLRLQPARVSPASLDHLLRLSCAFFLARCECRLLLAALGRHGGDGQWELAVVRERQRGHALQVAVDNAEKKLGAEPELSDGELDLYGGEEPADEEVAPPPSVGEYGADATPPGGRRRRKGPPSPDAAEGGSEQGSADLQAPPLRLQHLGDVGAEQTAAAPDPADPISFHCPSARLDPRLLCLTCGAFHGAACAEGRLCRSAHDARRLGVCVCGKTCPRKPLILCRRCGREFCSDCWYKNPLACSCGATFDLSTSV